MKKAVQGRKDTRLKQQKKPPKWKQYDLDKLKQRNKQIFKWIIRLTTYFIVGFLAFTLVRGVTDSRIQGEFRVNLALATPKLKLLSYDVDDESAIFITVNDDVYMDASHGYGDYRAGAISRLDKQERLKGQLLTDSAVHYFGVVIDGFIIDSKKERVEIRNRDELQRFLVRVAVKKLFTKDETNLSLIDLYKVWRAVGATRNDKFEVVDLTETNALSADYLPDGTKVYLTDELRMEALGERWFIDEALVKEKINTLVINETEASGVGSKVGKVLRNSGMHVVAVETGQSGEDGNKTIIYVRSGNLDKSLTIKRLKKYLGRDTQVVEKRVDDRAEVVVVIKTDFVKRLVGEE